MSPGSPEWQWSGDRLPLLQDKVNTYLAFVLDGQMMMAGNSSRLALGGDCSADR